MTAISREYDKAPWVIRGPAGAAAEADGWPAVSALLDLLGGRCFMWDRLPELGKVHDGTVVYVIPSDDATTWRAYVVRDGALLQVA